MQCRDKHVIRGGYVLEASKHARRERERQELERGENRRTVEAGSWDARIDKGGGRTINVLRLVSSRLSLRTYKKRIRQPGEVQILGYAMVTGKRPTHTPNKPDVEGGGKQLIPAAPSQRPTNKMDSPSTPSVKAWRSVSSL